MNTPVVVKPDDSQCCNSGCNPCILDIYQQRLREYEKSPSNTNITENCMKQTEFTVFALINKEKHTPNSYLLTFKYLKHSENENLSIQYKPGQHFIIKAKDNELKDFSRAYTPIPIDYDPINSESHLEFTILVHLYDRGRMSQFFVHLQLKEETLWRGPYGNFTLEHEPYTDHVLIAQGSGIAPLYAIIKTLLQEDDCYNFLKLYYCCRDFKGIMLRHELYQLRSYWNFTYEIYLTQNVHENEKLYFEVINDFRLNFSLICNNLKGKDLEKVRVLVCGSADFEKSVKNTFEESKIKNVHFF